MQLSGKDLTYFDDQDTDPNTRRFLPYVIEPSAGADRGDARVLYVTRMSEDQVGGEPRTVLKLHPRLAPIKAAVFPLVKKDGMPEKALEIYRSLKRRFNVFYDEKGAIGRRYRRQDEAGTPFCITIDGDTLSAGSVTVRERDSCEQVASRRRRARGLTSASDSASSDGAGRGSSSWTVTASSTRTRASSSNRSRSGGRSPGSLEAIAALTRGGFRVAVVTNQSGVGRGLFSEETLETIHARMSVAVRDCGRGPRGRLLLSAPSGRGLRLPKAEDRACCADSSAISACRSRACRSSATGSAMSARRTR